MPDIALSARVSAELESMTAPTGLMSPDGPLATIVKFPSADLALRAAEVAEEFLALQADVGKDGLAAVVTAGPPGVGKSTLLQREGFLSAGWRNLDADLVKELLILRAVREGTFGDLLDRELADGERVRPLEAASLVHRESVSILDLLTDICLRRGENVVIQGTLAWPKQPQRLLEELNRQSYEQLTIVDVEVDLATALERSASRWWEGRKDKSRVLGGRFMPARIIRDLYTSGGDTKTKVNAEFMFELSEIASSRLLVSTTSSGGIETRHEYTKGATAPSGMRR
jgi:hypothetical protein